MMPLKASEFLAMACPDFFGLGKEQNALRLLPNGGVNQHHPLLRNDCMWKLFWLTAAFLERHLYDLHLDNSPVLN
jgi:hypothetical protein